MKREDIYEAITTERTRQDRKWGSQSHHSGEKWATILGEEYGEVCKAVLERGCCDDEIKEELIQVAAVAVCWLECMNEGE